ncbi:ABC-2 type transport system ATP-binding protein [Actinopolyspora xinjiangensis]|uniref:ABC-2 type transport system ATP-binding protein n=1 Tax=Actinopolyspora xinjiangensis TaxID=405564 RepID=A0A1H0WVE2_9ACTN|nr:alpha/beta fold hydrolase [Actinopolyspora xinjiangensis]SDP94744.1 ABC-2 type transport system ATP-binding protein [Actinopolyspora xinjiangensis]
MFPSRRYVPNFALLPILLVALIVAATAMWFSEQDPADSPPRVDTRDARIDVLDGPGQRKRVQLDLRLFVPERTPAPAVVLAHGFDGDKTELAVPARRLAARGFTVLTYSARGFGHSTGRVALNAPDYEVTDARRILDWLARQPEVTTQGQDDPLVGVGGVSYGGALSMLLAGNDDRVDAIAPLTTYNDLRTAMLPNDASTEPISTTTAARGGDADRGVFRRAWARSLFRMATRPQVERNTSSKPDTSSTAPPPPEEPPDTGDQSLTCGNLTIRVCRAYTELARTGQAGQETLDLLEAASPSSVTSNIDIPTLLVQRQRGTLFGLEQADANARQINEAGGTVRMLWLEGGDREELPASVWGKVADWFSHYLHDSDSPRPPAPDIGFEYQLVDRLASERSPPTTWRADGYPGLEAGEVARFELPLRGSPTSVINPPGNGADTTSSSGNTAAGERAVGTVEAPRSPRLSRQGTSSAQVAVFETAQVERATRITGLPRTRLSVASVPGQPGDSQAVLFARLLDVGPDGSRAPVGDGSSPLRVTRLPEDGTAVQVDVALPATMHTLQPGHRLELRVSTTDGAYAGPRDTAVHRVALAGGKSVSLPSVSASPVEETSVPLGALIGIAAFVVLLVVAGVLAIRFERSRRKPPTPELADLPLAVEDVSKSYPGRPDAIHDLSLRVETGQVVGLLGPNGAGKTSLLRMVLGMTRADTGRIHLFGHLVAPSAPVLSRVGGLVESPGLLPHLTGLENLRSYWRATGRPMEQARLDEVVRIAALGSAADRKVRTYGPGMRQRVALAQAMLGLPDLLVLDEPMNALDPAHTQRMREVIREYARTGRTVLLSSHLLSEVEQTCTHVIVMREGRRVAGGTVDEITAGESLIAFHVDQPDLAARTLRCLEGIGSVRTVGEVVYAELAGHSTATAVNVLVASDISIKRVGPHRKLEDAFLELVGEDH